MKKFFTLTITMAFLSALMPTKVWALRYVTAEVKSEPSTGGYVYVTKDGNDIPSSSNQTTSSKKHYQSGKTFTFYGFAFPKDGYVFKGWSTSQSDNTGFSGNIITITYSGTNTALNYQTFTYYAIFARLTTNKNSLSFSVNRPNTEETIVR